LPFRLVMIVGLLLMAVLAWVLLRRPEASPVDPVGTTVAALSKQNRLNVFSAQVVTSITAREERLGGLVSAQTTAIIPATVHYQIDMAKIGADDLRWNAETRTMDVTLPPVEITDPQQHPERAQRYSNGALLRSVTDVGDRLTTATFRGADAQFRREAQSPQLMRLAEAAAKEAVARNIGAPLQAAGLGQVTVNVRFAHEGTRDPSQLDRSRRIEDVLKERERSQTKTS